MWPIKRKIYPGYLWKFAASFFLNEVPCLPIKKREKVTLASKKKNLFFIKKEKEIEKEKVIPKSEN